MTRPVANGSAGQTRSPLPSPGGVEVRDAVGNLLADGDQVTLIKDLKVKGANQTLNRARLSSRSG
jgi:protein PhnA